MNTSVLMIVHSCGTEYGTELFWDSSLFPPDSRYNLDVVYWWRGLHLWQCGVGRCSVLPRQIRSYLLHSLYSALLSLAGLLSGDWCQRLCVEHGIVAYYDKHVVNTLSHVEECSNHQNICVPHWLETLLPDCSHWYCVLLNYRKLMDQILQLKVCWWILSALTGTMVKWYRN